MRPRFALAGWACLAAFLLNPLFFFTVDHRFAHSIDILKNEAQLGYHQIAFSLHAESPSPIERAVLIHGVKAQTCQSSQARREVEIETSSTIKISWEWDLERSENLPPGAEIWWRWELTTADGSQLSTPVQTLTVEDTRYAWQKLERGKVSLYWAEGDRTFANTLLSLSVDSLARLAENAGLEPGDRVRVMVYPDAEGVRKAVVYSSEWIGGLAFPEYNVVLVGIGPDETSWAEEIIPHELAHLVTGKRLFNCLGSQLPTWLEEGLAEYAAGPAPETVKNTIHEALIADSLPALTSLANGFAADPARANQAYGQSRLVTAFLIEQYGPAKLDELFDQLRAGIAFEAALRSVYGLDTAGIDQAWRASLGYGSAPSPSFGAATSTTIPTAIATLPLFSPIPTGTAEPTFTPTNSPTLPPKFTHTPDATRTATPAVEQQPDGKRAPWLAGGTLLIISLAFGLLFLARKKNHP